MASGFGRQTDFDIIGQIYIHQMKVWVQGRYMFTATEKDLREECAKWILNHLREQAEIDDIMKCDSMDDEITESEPTADEIGMQNIHMNYKPII